MVVVFCWKLLISFEPKVFGKSFISTIFLISELVKAVGIFLKSTFPVVFVTVVVVVVWGCFKFCVIFCVFISSETAWLKYLLSNSLSLKFWFCWVVEICVKYLFISSLPSKGVTEATFPWFCCINFWISFIPIFEGIVVFDFAKDVGIWKYLFKSSPSSGSLTWIWLFISCSGWAIFCWIFIALLFVKGACTTCDKVFIGAALFCEVKTAKSTAPVFDIFDIFGCCTSWFCLIILFSSTFFLFGVSSGWLYCSISSSYALAFLCIWFWFWYAANSSGEYWFKFCGSFSIFSFTGVFISFCLDISTCLNWTGLDSFIATS